jgi:RNA polymerase sigma factor (sigma-70 family)
VEQLVQRYQPLLRAAVRRCVLPCGLERDDLLQEAQIVLLRAIAVWRPQRGPFPAFARRCVHNGLIHVLDTAGANKHRILSQAQPLAGADGERGEPGGAPIVAARGPRRSALMGASAAQAAEETVLARERLAALATAMVLLSDWERDALRDWVNGVPNGRLARERNVTPRAVALAARRARGKLAASVARDDLAA